MRLRNSFKIAVQNFGLTFKHLLYKAVVLALFVLEVLLVLKLRGGSFIESLSPVFNEIKAAVEGIFNGQMSSDSSIGEAFTAFISYISSHVGSLALTGAILLISAVFFKFLSGVGDCVIVILTDGYMSSMAKGAYLRTLVENIKKIAVYQLIDSLVSLILDALVVAFAYLLFSLHHIIHPIAAAFLAVAAFAAGRALTMAFTCQVRTNILVGNMKIKEGIKCGIKAEIKYFGRMYAEYLALTVIYTYLFVSVTLCTFGVGTVLLIPFSSLVVASTQLTDYYAINKKRYFIDYDNVVVPKELRENDEELLGDIDI